MTKQQTQTASAQQREGHTAGPGRPLKEPEQSGNPAGPPNPRVP